MKLGELASRIGARLVGDAGVDVARVRSVDDAGAGDLGFASSAKELRRAFHTRASALLVEEGFAADHAHELPCAVLAASPASRALAHAVDALHPSPPRRPGVDERAVVDPRAKLGADCSVGPLAVVGAAQLGARCAIAALAYVGDDVIIGDDSVVGAGAVVLAGTRIGARAVVGPGSVVGDEGFVFAPDGDANVIVRSVAGVVVGDGVDIGANACIDRGNLRDTRIGAGTKVDNLATVAHDVVIGDNAVIVAQVGIAGHAEIGDGAVLAGQAGVNPRVTVGKRARVGGQAGVTGDIDDGAAVAGTPAIPHLAWLKAMVRLKHLDALEKRVKALEERAK